MVQRAIKIQIRVHRNPLFLPSRIWNFGRYVVPAYRIYYKEKSKSTKITWSKSRLIAILVSRTSQRFPKKTHIKKPEASEAGNELFPIPRTLSTITTKRIHLTRKTMSSQALEEMNSIVILISQSLTQEKEEGRKAVNLNQNLKEEAEVVHP